MKMLKRCKKGCAGVLALLILLPLLVVPQAYGANGIEVGRVCTITFKLDGQYPELDNLPIPVKLYQVASVATDGSYTALDAFKGLDFSKANSEATAQMWSEMAQQASKMVTADTPAAAQIQIQKAEGQEHATGRAEGLSTGMYLVIAESVQSEQYVYDFIPYLVALPNNYYATTGDDTWVYDVDTELKPEQQEQFGSLIIDKTLTSYNATLAGAEFVFQVEAIKDGKKVYSNVHTLSFDGTGTKSLQIDRLPAGAQVTVTEVYSGASYQVTTSPKQTVTIIADGQDGSPVRVSFENEYDDHPNGGNSILNHFKYNNGAWDVEQLKDSTSE